MGCFEEGCQPYKVGNRGSNRGSNRGLNSGIEHSYCTKSFYQDLVVINCPMPIPEKYMVDFEENGIFHVYNRTNNNELLFRSDHNRNFFLSRYRKYISYLADSFCWCLLSNHFHFLIRIKREKIIRNYLNQKPVKDQTIQEKRFLENEINCSELVESAFKRMFQSYALAFNKCYRRKGNLFYKPFKRVSVNKESHFTQAKIYIHYNPVKD